jgi:hypothetical protein
MSYYLAKAGLTREELAKRVVDLAQAAEIRTSCYMGEWSYSDPVPALRIQAQALDMAAKLAGSYPDQRINISGDVSANATLQLSREDRLILKQVAGELVQAILTQHQATIQQRASNVDAAAEGD